MKVVILTEQQKDLLLNKEYIKGCYFNPIQDKNDNWFISLEEVNMCENEEFFWIKELDLIDYEPIVRQI